MDEPKYLLFETLRAFALFFRLAFSSMFVDGCPVRDEYPGDDPKARRPRSRSTRGWRTGMQHAMMMVLASSLQYNVSYGSFVSYLNITSLLTLSK